ncbi:MAG: hypothetical protein WC100_03430 [Sterolibacterium sp.]
MGLNKEEVEWVRAFNDRGLVKDAGIPSLHACSLHRKGVICSIRYCDTVWYTLTIKGQKIADGLDSVFGKAS